jgi:hypothetical protein
MSFGKDVLERPPSPTQSHPPMQNERFPAVRCVCAPACQCLWSALPQSCGLLREARESPSECVQTWCSPHVVVVPGTSYALLSPERRSAGPTCHAIWHTPSLVARAPGCKWGKKGILGCVLGARAWSLMLPSGVFGGTRPWRHAPEMEGSGGMCAFHRNGSRFSYSRAGEAR